MGSRLFLAVVLVVLTVVQAPAQAVLGPLRATEEARARTEPLMQVLGMRALLEIIHQEGLAHGADLGQEMFPGRGQERWSGMVARIYDVERMGLIMLDEMAADIEPWDLDPLLDFFDSALGHRIVGLEVSARQAMLDPSVEAASNDYLAMLRDEGGRRLDLLEEFAIVNDLIETNVTAALNANFAFYTGLNGAGAFGVPRDEGEMLREIWRQENQIRQDTALWVMSYLALAYQPLDDDDLQAYIDFSRSSAGRHMNTDLFDAFNELFQTISNEMGRAAAQFIGGEDL